MFKLNQISVPDLELVNSMCENIRKNGRAQDHELLNGYMEYLGSKYDFNPKTQGVHPISGKIVNFDDYPLGGV